MAHGARQRIAPWLLALVGHRHAEFDHAALSNEDWCDLDAMAAEYRLQPLLHARCERGEFPVDIPASIRVRWRTAHRDSALLALAQRSEMYAVVERLRSSGIEAVALKGAWLAWYAYPAAAERPMRDVDLIVPQQQVLAAWHCLRDAGFQPCEASADTPEDRVGHAKHLQPLMSPAGVEFELHQMLWERGGAMEWPMPREQIGQVAGGAILGDVDDPARYPSARDTLVHLVVHAAYSHRFDVGPLLLADIDYTLARLEPDWPRFWEDATARGYARGAALVFALVDRWRRPGLLDECACPVEVSPLAVDDAQMLLLQDYAARKDTALAASLLTRGIGAARRIRGHHRPRHAANLIDRHEGFAAWLARRAGEAVRAFGRADIRRTARRRARVGAWLDGGEA